jgi:hypothetical protein
MIARQPCGAIAGRYCSGESTPDECLECMDHVNTCDECHSAGSNESIGWHEGPSGQTLCDQCYRKSEGKA